jgi:uncharacterized protein (DUF4415 family)
MGKRSLAGITGVLGGLVSPVGNEGPIEPPCSDLPGNEAGPPEHNPSRALSPRSRLGRPPGRTRNQVVPKEKVTLRISAELVAEYREWSWQRRCQLGELVEAALRAYVRRLAGGG